MIKLFPEFIYMDEKKKKKCLVFLNVKNKKIININQFTVSIFLGGNIFVFIGLIYITVL